MMRMTAVHTCLFAACICSRNVHRGAIHQSSTADGPGALHVLGLLQMLRGSRPATVRLLCRVASNGETQSRYDGAGNV